MNVNLKLKQFFEKKKKKSPSFTLRLFAGKLSISPSMLSLILSGKRTPSMLILEKACELLDIDKETEDTLRIELLKNKNLTVSSQDLSFSRSQANKKSQMESSNWSVADDKQFIALNSWHYFAVMQTTLLKDYDGTSEFIATFLGIKKKEALRIVDELKSVGLLALDEKSGLFKKTNRTVEYQSRKKEQLRRHHISNMENAIQVLRHKNTDYNCNNRLVTSACFTCKLEQIPLIKQEISSFIKKTSATDESEGHDEVCQLSIQFIPLSQK